MTHMYNQLVYGAKLISISHNLPVLVYLVPRHLYKPITNVHSTVLLPLINFLHGFRAHHIYTNLPHKRDILTEHPPQHIDNFV